MRRYPEESPCPFCERDTHPVHDPDCPLLHQDRPIQMLAEAHLRLLSTLQPILDTAETIPTLAQDLQDLLNLISDDYSDPTTPTILN